MKWTRQALIVARMREARISQTDMAKRLGVSKTWLTLVLNKHRKGELLMTRLEEELDQVELKMTG